MREKDELDHDIEPTPIAGSGELEIEYTFKMKHLFDKTGIDLKCTIAYRYWSIDIESVDAEYKIIGSANYLPSDFEQLIRDYLYELPELKGQRINELKPVTRCVNSHELMKDLVYSLRDEELWLNLTIQIKYKVTEIIKQLETK